MTYNPDYHHRRSIRLSGYDYSQSGAYFVTICTQDRILYFGDVINGRMILNDAGRMVDKAVCEIPVKYPGIEIDTVVIMPNHVHVTIVLSAPTTTAMFVGAPPRGRPLIGSNQGRAQEDTGWARGPAPTDESFNSNDVDNGREQGPVSFNSNDVDNGRARDTGRAQRPAPTDDADSRLSLFDVVERFK